jgi:predicted RNase H-like nuclease (RuvC/YqgF family)
VFFLNSSIFLNTKNPRPISATVDTLPKTTLDKDFQKKRQENYQKDVEREKMEKEIERQKLENEKNQREIDEMKRQLSKLATASSNLQVNLFQNSLFAHLMM